MLQLAHEAQVAHVTLWAPGHKANSFLIKGSTSRSRIDHLQSDLQLERLPQTTHGGGSGSLPAAENGHVGLTKPFSVLFAVTLWLAKRR
jgi:hypothetical protein